MRSSMENRVFFFVQQLVRPKTAQSGSEATSATNVGGTGPLRTEHETLAIPSHSHPESSSFD